MLTNKQPTVHCFFCGHDNPLNGGSVPDRCGACQKSFGNFGKQDAPEVDLVGELSSTVSSAFRKIANQSGTPNALARALAEPPPDPSGVFKPRPAKTRATVLARKGTRPTPARAGAAGDVQPSATRRVNLPRPANGQSGSFLTHQRLREPTKQVKALPAGDVKDLRVLIVDDNSITSSLVQSKLGRVGCDSVVADSLDSADLYLKSAAFDLLMVYESLGGIPCVDAISKLRSTCGHPDAGGPVLLITSTSGAGDEGLNVEGFVSIPQDLLRMAEILQAVVDGDLTSGRLRHSQSLDLTGLELAGLDVRRIQKHYRDDPQFLRTSIEKSVGEVPEHLMSLAEALESHDAATAIDVCELLHQEVKPFGAISFLRHLEMIQKLAVAGAIDQTSGFMETLEAEYARIFRTLIGLRDRIHAIQG